MKIAIIGSRNISDVDLSKYIDQNVTEIVSGGARGVDSIAKNTQLIIISNTRSSCPNIQIIMPQHQFTHKKRIEQE